MKSIQESLSMWAGKFGWVYVDGNWNSKCDTMSFMPMLYMFTFFSHLRYHISAYSDFSDHFYRRPKSSFMMYRVLYMICCTRPQGILGLLWKYLGNRRLAVSFKWYKNTDCRPALTWVLQCIKCQFIGRWVVQVSPKKSTHAHKIGNPNQFNLQLRHRPTSIGMTHVSAVYFCCFILLYPFNK